MNRPRGRCNAPWKRWAVMVTAILCLAWFFWWSNTALQTETFDFVSDRLPEAFDGSRVVILSDLHGATFGENNGKLTAAVTAAQPDAIVVTGDLEDRFRGHDPAWVQQTAELLVSVAPVYYVTGNHEWANGDVRSLKKTLQETGWTVLDNRSAAIERDGAFILLAGVDDPNGYVDQKSPETVAAALHAQYGDPFWILLAHRNNFFEKQYSLLGADLTISGHGHGGMIRLPLTDGLLSVDRTLFPSYTAGFYEANGATVFVSRGLGNSGPSFRLFNRPQVAVVTLRSGGSSK